MKRIFVAFLLLIFLCGCDNRIKEEKTPTPDFMSGVWITYSEINDMLKGGNFKKEFAAATEKCKSKQITDIFVAIRPFCNSLYKSKYYPQNEYASRYGFDVFEYILEKAHKNGIKVHAWINPYRVASSGISVESLPDNSPIKSMTEGEDYIVLDGIYLNPASQNTLRLIIDGVREVCIKYKIDGVHFDDYFYPTKEESFDKISFEAYSKSGDNPLSLYEYRTANVNSLISAVYTAVKFTSKNILFSVSPCGSIEKNINDYYADVKSWCENGCVDMIIPQLYFGFEYPDENFRFDGLLDEWKNLLSDSTAALAIGLANYKINTDSLPDKDEWKNGEEIIKRQTEICRNDRKVKGVVYFSYSYLF